MKKILIGLVILSNIALAITTQQADIHSREFYKAYTGKELKIPIMFKDFKEKPVEGQEGYYTYTCGEYHRYGRMFNDDVQYIVYDLKHIQEQREGDTSIPIETIAHEVAHKINSDNGYSGHGKEFQETYRKMLDLVKSM